MNIHRILVGVELTEKTDIVLAQALSLARRHRAEVTLAHVIQEGLEPPPGSTARAGYADLMGLYQQQVREKLWALRPRFDADLRVSELLLEGAPAPTLAIAADEIDADLVILGSHSRSGLKQLILGSVAERTVRFADRTVLVVKSPPPAHGRYRRILVPTDFSPAAEQALEVGLRMAAPDAELELLHCWTTPVYQGALETTSIGMLMLSSEIEREVRNQGMRLVEAHSEQGVRLRFHHVESKASYGIQDRLESQPFDLVVMGSHGRSGLGRWLLGSVAEHTVRHAPCSVMVIKAPEDE